jgi:ferredoxin
MSFDDEIRQRYRLVALAMLAAWCGVAASSCKESAATPTQVVVLIEAEPQTRARMKGGYVDGQIRYVRLVLEDMCLDVSNSCEQPETCHMGACVTAIRVDPERFATSAQRAPNAAELDLPPPNTDAGAAGMAGDDGK